MVKVGINGFGRIGRLILRAILENYKNKIQVVAINDLGSIETNAHLIKYDSTHGIINEDIQTSKDGFKIGNQEIKVFAEKDPANIPWGKVGADVVLECTGIFLDKSSAEKHIKGGAKKVIISAPGKEVDFTIVQGVNSKELKKEHNIISNGSCTTNCLAPVAMVLEKTFGISYGYMTTIHSYTGDQRILDNSHRDLRRARAAATNIVPTSTGAAKAVALVYPEMKGKLTGIAMRVPTPNVSAVDFVYESSKSVTAEEVNNALKEASLSAMKGIIKYGDEPLVSSDYAGTNESSIVDSDLTMCIGDNLVKVLAWYDNEWGYSQRVVDLAEIVAKNWE